MQPKTKRNVKIFQEKMSGMTYRQLVKKYDLSQSCIYNIIRREQKRLHDNEIEI